MRFDDFMERRSSWTLRDDSNLICCLSEMTSDMLNSIKDFDDAISNMTNDTELLKLRLENIYNNIHLIKATKLVEEHITESSLPENGDYTKTDHDSRQVGEAEERTTSAIKYALSKGLLLLDEHFKVLNTMNSALIAKPVFEVKNLYESRPLPSIIGSAEFHASIDANLCVHASHSSFKTDVSTYDKTITQMGNTSSPTTAQQRDELTIKNRTELDAVSDRIDDSLSIRSDTDRRLPSSGVPSIGRSDSRSQTPSNQSIQTFGSGNSIKTPQQRTPSNNIPASGGTDFRDALVAVLRTNTKLQQEKPIQSCKADVSKENRDIVIKTQALSSANEIGSTSEKSISTVSTSEEYSCQPADTNSRNLLPESGIGSLFTDSKHTNTRLNVSSLEPILKQRPGRGLFSSSSSSTSEDGGVISSVALPTGKLIPALTVIEPQNSQASYAPTQIKEKITAVEEDMSKPKPVLKAFDDKFSDRLSATLLKNKMSSNVVTKRPMSVSSSNVDKVLESSTDGKISQRRPTSRTSSRSSISSNEEFGPSSVASRIAQIGNKIPTGMKRDEVNEIRTIGLNADNQSSQDSSSLNSELPPRPSTSAVMSRAKGPARRAPKNTSTFTTTTEKIDRTCTAAIFTDSSSCIVDNVKINRDVSKVEETIITPKAAFERTTNDSTRQAGANMTSKPTITTIDITSSSRSGKQEQPKKKSIFDSSTSDEDDFLTPRTSAKLPIKLSERVIAASLPTAKTIISQPKKKSLFEDSDSDI